MTLTMRGSVSKYAASFAALDICRSMRMGALSSARIIWNAGNGSAGDPMNSENS